MKKKVLIVAVIVILVMTATYFSWESDAVTSTLSFLDNPALPRGLRNNNPGNLRPLPNGEKWNGEIENDNGPGGPYCRFRYLKDGVRAEFVNLHSYIAEDGRTTPRTIGDAWTPAGDGSNVAGQKANAIASALNIGLDDTVDFLTQGKATVVAINHDENTVDPIPGNLYDSTFAGVVVEKGLS